MEVEIMRFEFFQAVVVGHCTAICYNIRVGSVCKEIQERCGIQK